MQQPVFIEGEPVLSGGRHQEAWQSQIGLQVSRAVTHPKLTFIVANLTRRGQRFDLDNLVHPVLMVFEEPVDGVNARLYVGDRPGLLVESSIAGDSVSDAERIVYVPVHSDFSVRDRSGIPEINNDPVLDKHEGIGLSLAFDSRDIPIRRGWFGPTEAVIDDLTPWLGTYTERAIIADHRIRDLRISRGVSPTSDGVKITVWYVPDEDVPIPDDVLARIEEAERS